MPTDWKTLAKETVHSFDADEVRGMWDVDFRTQLPVDPSPAAMIESLNRVLCETGNARSFFAGLFRKPGACPNEAVSALAADLDLFLGRVAAEDDVSIAAVRRKSA